MVRALAGPGPNRSATAERMLGLFAPAATILLLVAWLVALFVAFGLILFGLRDQLEPQPPNIGTAIYFAASSVLTIGYGDIVATGTLARIVVVAAAVCGLGIVALVVTFLFSLYGSYQRREAPVVLLQAKAGSPLSAVVLLENLARFELTDHLPLFFGEWERWIVEVLDSHVAYPLLGYFRSSHDNLSWISALGTVLDTATLVLTTIDGVPRGQAELAKALGDHLVEDITNLGNRAPASSSLDRPSFDAVYAAPRGRRLSAGARGRSLAGVRGRAGLLRGSTRADGRLLGRRRPCRGSAAARRSGRRRTGRQATTPQRGAGSCGGSLRARNRPSERRRPPGAGASRARRGTARSRTRSPGRGAART